MVGSISRFYVSQERLKESQGSNAVIYKSHARFSARWGINKRRGAFVPRTSAERKVESVPVAMGSPDILIVSFESTTGHLHRT